MIDRTIETDVLIIGGGGGGMRAAISAHDEGARVLVLSKGIVGKSGLTQTAVTGFQAAFGYADPRDNADIHFQDSVRGGYGLADPALYENRPTTDLQIYDADYERMTTERRKKLAFGALREAYGS